MKSLKKTVLGMREFGCDQVGNSIEKAAIQVQKTATYSLLGMTLYNDWKIALCGLGNGF
jgi:hypothetical protein